MQLEPVERIGWTEQDRLDEWFDRAMKDESVRPYLTTGVQFPRLEVPEYTQDGVVLMNKRNTGVLKLYFDEESRTVRLGIWVLESELPKRVTSLSLLNAGLVVIKQNPLIRFVATRVMETNGRGRSFCNRLLDEWGHEKFAVFDTGRLDTSMTGSWVDWVHYRISLKGFEMSVKEWIQSYER